MSLRYEIASGVLQKIAKRNGLQWVIRYGSVEGSPDAHWLVKDGGKEIIPPEVIGETMEQAKDTINLAGAMLKRGRRK